MEQSKVQTCERLRGRLDYSIGVKGDGHDERHTGTASEHSGVWCFFVSMIREGGDAYAESKSTSSLWVAERLVRCTPIAR